MLKQSKRRMTPRERLRTVLKGGIPDRVPWIEVAIDEEIQVALAGHPNCTPSEVCAAVGIDGYGINLRPSPAKDPRATSSGVRWKERHYYPDRPTTLFFPPLVVEHGVNENGRFFVKHGLIREPKDLKMFDEWLPDPDHPTRYERVQNWFDEWKGDYLNIALISLGTEHSVHSMGLDNLALSIYDDPQFVHDVLERYGEWCARTAEHVSKLDVDLIIALNDVADNHGSWISPDMFREFFLPPIKEVARQIKKPWIYHSDGNIESLLPDLLPLGMSGIHGIQPGPMDIAQIKQEWGDKLILHGNIDMVYILTQATAAEVDENVRHTISVAGPGGHIIASTAGLPNYCKPENIRAMGAAIEKYGYYSASA